MRPGLERAVSMTTPMEHLVPPPPPPPAAVALYRIANFTIGPESSLRMERHTERQKHRLNRTQKAHRMRS